MPRIPKPESLSEPDWSTVRRYAEEYLDSSAADREHGDDIHYMHEAVMVAVFGPTVFAYMNQPDEPEGSVGRRCAYQGKLGRCRLLEGHVGETHEFYMPE